MPGYVMIVDGVAALFAAIGFCMAFRQRFVRRLFGASQPFGAAGGPGDPLTYALRIAGVMVMMFSLALAGMLTLFNLA